MFLFSKFKDPDSKVCKKHAVVRHRCGVASRVNLNPPNQRADELFIMYIYDLYHFFIMYINDLDHFCGHSRCWAASQMCTQLPASISRTPLEFRLLIIQIRWLVMCSRYDFDQTSKGVKNTFQRTVAHASQRNWTQTQSKRPQTKLNQPDPNFQRTAYSNGTSAKYK